MKNSPYYKQAELMLRILPIINNEKVFALKGGTAINFFFRNSPGLNGIEKLPAVQWKLENISKIKSDKHELACKKLETYFLK